jgi:hypothetical protein
MTLDLQNGRRKNQNALTVDDSSRNLSRNAGSQGEKGATPEV